MINNSRSPLVSIGMPVHNAEKYLPEALESIKSQTYENFEVIISDNGSTDRTPEICGKVVSSDSRFIYFRNETNIGVARNFNRVYELSSGEYFKWWAYDDLCAPTYLERCVEVLRKEPAVIICHAKTRIIDQTGRVLGDYDDCLHFRSQKPFQRFREYLFRRAGLWNAIYGLIRSSEFRKTPLHGDYLGADQVLLGELILRGEVHRVPESLFFRRGHPDQFWRNNASKAEELDWFKPGRREGFWTPVAWKIFIEYLRALRRVELHWLDKTRCQLYLVVWLSRKLIKPFYFPVKKRLIGLRIISEKPKKDPWSDLSADQDRGISGLSLIHI